MIRWVVGGGESGKYGENIVASDSSSANSSTLESPAEAHADDEETYVEWIKHATGISEMHFNKSGIENWI